MVFVLPEGRQKQRRTSVRRWQNAQWCVVADLCCWLDDKQGELEMFWIWQTGSPPALLQRTGQVGKFLSAPNCSVEHGLMKSVRVGEASHPGPSSRLRLEWGDKGSPDKHTGVSCHWQFPQSVQVPDPGPANARCRTQRGHGCARCS